MSKRITKAFYLPMIGLLFACSPQSSVPSASGSVVDSSEAALSSESVSAQAKPEKTKMETSSLRDLFHADGRDLIASLGKQNILVLPIEFSGYSFTNDDLNSLDACLNGNGEEDTNYWESLSSYYEKSSYGKLKLSYEIATPYLAKDAQGNPLTPYGVYSTYGPGSGNGSDNGLNMIQNAYRQFLEENGEEALRELDGDHNGYIDGVIAVYACPDYYSGGFYFDRSTYFWAYTYWASVGSTYMPGIDVGRPSLECPGIDVYFWTSINFMFDSIYTRQNPGSVDSHTFIHETGHMLGLDDYYPSGTAFSPMGGMDMMDLNILDHNSFSKLLLGWVDPYIVTDAIDITLRPFESSGDCILIPTSSFNGSPFDEYLMIEYYTPTGLNELDSSAQLDWDRPVGYQTPGVRIMHVDARVAKYWTELGSMMCEYVDDSLFWDDDDCGYRIAASNCFKTGLADSSYSLVQTIEASGKNSFAKGELGGEDTLFKEGDNFLIYQYSSSFPKGKTFNNGEEFPYSIFIMEMDDESVSISIEKFA